MTGARRAAVIVPMRVTREARPRAGDARCVRAIHVSPMKKRMLCAAVSTIEWRRGVWIHGVARYAYGIPMHIERHRESRAADDAWDPISRADHRPRIATHHLLRIAMHFGASYIRDADIRGPSAYQRSTPSSISQSTAFALHDHSRRQRTMVPLTSRKGRCRTTGCRGAIAGTVRRHGRRSCALLHWPVLSPPRA